MLILAGVTINAVFDKNGILKNSKKFANMVESEQNKKEQEINSLINELENSMIEEEVKDEKPPLDANIELGSTQVEIEKEIIAKVTLRDNESGVNIGQSKYIYNQTATAIDKNSAEWNNAKSFTTNPQELKLTASTAGTYYLQVLTVDNAGNKKVTVSTAIAVQNILVTSITINEKEITKKVGDQPFQLTTTIVPTNATNKTVSWSSNKTAVVEVSNSGLVTIKGAGTATITVKAKDGSNKTATCTVKVETPVMQVTTAHIGEKVNYVAKDYTDLTWRIFYYDSNYVYLISEKQDGSNPVDSFTLSSKISGKYANGSNEVNTNLRFLNQKWYNQLNGTASTLDNAKAVAYLMDQTVWAGYKDSAGKAAYAIGGQTIELFANSFNATAPNNGTSNRITPTCTSNNGYGENTKSNWLQSGYNNGIYNNVSNSSWWLASPYGTSSSDVCIMNGGNGYLANYGVTNSRWARPVVLIPKSNFTFTIQN